MKKFLPFGIGLLLTLALLWPLFVAPYFTHHDDVQNIRLFEMNKCVLDVQLPCRWVPDLGGLYGYPLFNYYGPLPYYYGEVWYFLSHSLIFSAKMMFATGFVASFIFMYLATRKLWGSWGGSFAAIIYSYSPYHSVDFYVRGAMGELWALAFFPAILWATLRLKEKPSWGNSVLLSVCLAGLVLAHNLSAMLFFPIVGVFVVGAALISKNGRFFKFFCFSLVLGLTLSAFYWIPAYFEKSLVHLETTVEGYFSYTEHFKGLRKLFLDRSWGWGASVREIPGGEKDGLSFQIGYGHILIWLLSMIAAIKLWKKQPLLGWVIGFFSIVLLGAVFMINPKSEVVWKSIDSLKYLQFPWRFLEIIIFAIAIMSGSVLMLIRPKYKMLVYVVGIALIVGLNFSYFRPEKFLNITDQSILSGSSWDSQIKRSIYDYLPIYAKAPPAELATVRYQLVSGGTSINNFKENSQSLNFSSTSLTPVEFRWSQYYFPDWQILVDNQKVAIDYHNDLGLITFIIPSGNHKVVGQFKDTPIRTYSNWASLAAVTLTFGLFLIKIRKRPHLI